MATPKEISGTVSHDPDETLAVTVSSIAGTAPGFSIRSCNARSSEDPDDVFAFNGVKFSASSEEDDSASTFLYTVFGCTARLGFFPERFGEALLLRDDAELLCDDDEEIRSIVRKDDAERDEDEP